MCIRIAGTYRQLLISLCLYVGQLGVGFYTAWSGTIIPKLRDPEQSPIPYKLTEAEISLVSTVAYLGAIPGPYVSGWLSNTIGRKPCLIGGGALSFISCCLLATATTLTTVYVARFLLGFFGGIVLVMSIVYIGEIASTNIRGVLLSAIGVCQTCGTILLFACGPFFSYSETTFIGSVLFIVFTIGAILIPESPMLYVLKGNNKKVKEVLVELGRSEDVEELMSAKEMYVERSNTRDWIELFTIRSNRQSLFMLLVINILQNCSGYLAVIFFSSSIFKMSGSSVSSNISMIIIGLFQVMGSTLSTIFIEKIGRKKMLLISTFVCAVNMFVMGLYFYLNMIDSSLVRNFKWLPLVVLILFFISYDFGFGVIPNVIVGEMFTTNVRSKGSSITMSLSWFFGFFVVTGCGVLLETVGGHVTFWFFTCTCASAFLFTMFFIPETKGKSLMKIQQLLSPDT